MVHHTVRGIHKMSIHTHKAMHKMLTYYARNPHKIVDHGSTAVSYGGMAAKSAGKAAVHIGKLSWTHGPKVAKHTTKFMAKAALRGFKLFSS